MVHNPLLPLVRLVLAMAILLVACSCSRAAPAGFWTTYRSDLIARQSSEQGPWGGVRWIHWLSPVPATFNGPDVIAFASSKGWACKAPVAYSAAQVALWRMNDQAVFPLHFVPSGQKPNHTGVLEFPRHITGDSIVYECTTGWARVEPGSAAGRDAFGYIQVERTGTRIAVYHLWGES